MNKKVIVGFLGVLGLVMAVFWISDANLFSGALKKISLKKSAPQQKAINAKKKSAEEQKNLPAPKLPVIPQQVETPKIPALTDQLLSAPTVSPQTSTLENFIQFQKQAIDDASAQRKQMIDLLNQILAVLNNANNSPSTIIYQTVPSPPAPPPASPGASPSPAPAPAPSPTPPSPAPTPIEPGLIGYWSFDNMEANIVKDSSGVQHEAETKGNPKLVAGKVGQALEFDGIDDYITLPALPEVASGKNVSLEAWINTSESNRRAPVIYIGQWPSNGFGLEQSNSACNVGSVLAAIAHNAACDLIGADFVLKTDEWIHAVLTRGDNKWKLYVNGELKKVGSQIDPKLATENITIGAGAANFGGEAFAPFKGLIDEVKIYNRELQHNEIKEKHQSVQKDLVGYWNFDNPKNLLIDSGGSGNQAEWISEPKPVGGIFGNALEFDGKSAIALTLPNINTSPGTKITAAFWMKWSGQLEQMPFGFQQYDLYLQATTPPSFGFNTGIGDSFGIGTADSLINKWVHVVAEFTNGDSTLNKLYLNGIEQSLSIRSGIIGNGSITTNAYIGSWGVTETYRFKGQIDEVKIYNRALMPEEVKAEFAL
ncbi:LamG domain-containing protein [Candidatus Peregrinibacteria bacterium]|nr:LamG domain-containing protein [Candidatus Peregrinibacteria bacterium]